MKKKCLFLLLLTSTSVVLGQHSKLEATVYVTAQNTSLRLSKQGNIRFIERKEFVETENYLTVDKSKTFQTILGIGGAITDASAEVFYRLPTEKQQELISAYYDPEKGIGYTLARTNMNSCDFSSDMYTYVADNDSALKTFNIDHDKKYRIPLIRAAYLASKSQLTTFISPWSPPAWMKTNIDMLHGGKLLPQYRQAWANYFTKYIKALAGQGINVWGMTVQNEPMAKQTWESCIFSAEDECDFVKNYLGPTLIKAGLANKKIIIWDHNRDFMFSYANTILKDPEAAKYIWGTGYHWYETWKGGDMQFKNEQITAAAFPDKNLLFTEGCNDHFNPDSLYNWSHGEKYGYSMINDFNNGTVGWTDWNILLDEHGGPNHVGNFCFAPIHADSQTGNLIYTSAYYYLGHFSKFIRPGAKRISVSSNNDKLLATAFLNTNDKIVVVAMNRTDKPLPVHICLGGEQADFSLLSHSIGTILIN